MLKAEDASIKIDVTKQKALITLNEEIKRTPHSLAPTEILNELIKQIIPVDFKKVSGFSGIEELKNNHFQIIVIEQILLLAKANNWGICRNHDFIYIFNGAYWALLEDVELKVFLGKAAEKMGVNEYKAKYFKFRDELYKQFVALGNLPKLDSSKELIQINLNNGTFEISPSATRLRPFNSNDFITYQLPFDYNPLATAPIFEKYLNDVLPDKECQSVLSEYLGYIFVRSGTLKLEKTLLLYGQGANGKSVFYEVVRKLLGDQNTSEYSLQSLTNENGYYRAMIANKLVNYASEINGRLETSRFKQLVSGEPVEARLPYGKPFILAQYAKLIFNCNELPSDVEQTDAFFRRFLIIPFEITIPEHEQDKQLAHKIINSELSGVFNWVLKGLQRLLDHKNFSHCAAAQRSREQYERESDSVKQFIHELGYRQSPSSYIVRKTLYEEYVKFCSEDGYRPVNSRNFSRRLERYKFLVERKNIGYVVYATKEGCYSKKDDY